MANRLLKKNNSFLGNRSLKKNLLHLWESFTLNRFMLSPQLKTAFLGMRVTLYLTFNNTSKNYSIVYSIYDYNTWI